jgi:outer membrane beta-barrel protein
MMSAREERSFRERKGLFAMKRFILALAFAAVVIGGTTVSPQRVSAQEILLEGPLAGAPAVSKAVQFRNKRFSIGPQFAYNFLGSYMHHFLVGGRIEYNFLDWLGLGAVAYYSFGYPTSLTRHVSESENLGGDGTSPTDSNWPGYSGAANYEKQVGILRGMYLAQLNFVPFRGKMSMFEKVFVAIDGSIFVGGGIVHYEERKSCDGTKGGNNECGNYWGPDGYRETGENLDELEAERENKIGGAFTWGVNFMAYFTDWFALNLEFRMTPFKWNEGGSDEAGQSATLSEYVRAEAGSAEWARGAAGSGDYPDGKIGDEDRSWNLNMSIAIGFIFYLPLKPTIAD